VETLIEMKYLFYNLWATDNQENMKTFHPE